MNLFTGGERLPAAPSFRDRRGFVCFTLIELMMVCLILSILLALFLPAAVQVRLKSSDITCTHNFRELALACCLYANDNSGYPPPALLPPPCGHWLNLICVDYLGDRNGSILQCPLIETEDGFNPYGGDERYDCRIHTTILINIIREGHDGGWSASGVDFGADPNTILGWTRGTAFDTIPFRHAENPATAIFLAEGRKTIKNTMNGIGIFRFSESDHGIPELRDSRQTNAGERKVSWRHSGRFCVLFADGHTVFISRSTPQHWIVWHDNTSP